MPAAMATSPAIPRLGSPVADCNADVAMCTDSEWSAANTQKPQPPVGSKPQGECHHKAPAGRV